MPRTGCMRCVAFDQVSSEFVISKQHGFRVHTPTTVVNYDRAHTDFESLSHRWATNGIQVIRLRNEDVAKSIVQGEEKNEKIFVKVLVKISIDSFH